MSTAEILDQLPKLSPKERRAILDRLMELDQDADVLEERRRLADDAFQMLDAMENEDAQRKSG
jgi:DNA repair exonuclease SbcCD ATPase subunit